jgi:hypothetical protein
MIQKLNVKAICDMANNLVSDNNTEEKSALYNFYNGEVLNKRELQSIIDFLNKKRVA